jgi:hypothetical protein
MTSEIHNTWYGIMWLQFMQFWPGKMSLWFGSKKNSDLSPIGRYVQKSVIDESGNKVLKWRKPVYDQYNKDIIVDYEETTDDTGDPWIEWEGTPQEGLFMSVLLTIKDLSTFNWTNIKNNELRNRRALYGLAEGMLMWLFFSLLSKLIKGWIADNGTEGLTGETMEFFYEVDNKILNESKVFDNTFGALRSQPAFWTYSTRAVGDLYDFLKGDRTTQQLISKNIRAFEFWNE